MFLAVSLAFCMSGEERDTISGPLFSEVSSQHSGVHFSNDLTETNEQNFLKYPYLYNGGGVAVGDLNNDDLPDIYFTGNMAGDHLYFNEGSLQFSEVTQKAGIIKSNLWTTGVTFADVNNDGWLDIYVCRSGMSTFRQNLLYVNQQNGKFLESAKLYGLNDNGYSVQANFFDFDLDGDLDMYLVNHSARFFSTQEELFELKNNPNSEEADKLYRNNGTRAGSDQVLFEDVSESSGIRHFGFGLSASIGDLNQDGFPDIYVANDFFEPDFLYLNNGDGSFHNQIDQLLGHISFSSMGSDIADFNNDGLLDIMVCDMQASDNFRKKANMASMDIERFATMVKEGFHYQYMQNALQLNSGSGRFSEIAELSGVAETDWSWGPLFFDMDNNGLKDLFVSNGIRRDIQYKDILLEMKKDGLDPSKAEPMDFIERFPVQRQRNYTFQNSGELDFVDMSDSWGVDFKGFSTGSAYADFDKDGDLDLVLNNLDDKAKIYENQISNWSGANFIDIKLVGSPDNIWGYGSRVECYTKGRLQMVYVQSSRGFQSSVDPVAHFGVGEIDLIDSVVVIWPNGSVSKELRIAANQRFEIHQSKSANHLAPKGENRQTLLAFDSSFDSLYLHLDRVFDDFEREVLLPHKYSQLGPHICVGDVNMDGLDDFYVGGARGYSGGLFIQTISGEFELGLCAAFQKDMDYEDTGGIFFDADGDGDLDLYVVSGSNEWKDGSEKYIDRLYLNDGFGTFARNEYAFSGIATSGSAVCSGDFDGDGDLDLFVGGRIAPGKYPLAPRSYILRNDGSGIFADASSVVVAEEFSPGMVTDATWTDYDDDGDLDLVMVGEWMPITIYMNTNGKLELTPVPGLEHSTGWWYAVEKGDFDGDGDLDFVVGNLGKNYKYKTSELEPFQVYSDDFDESGTMDIVLGYFNGGTLYPLRGRQCSSEQMPFLKEKFPSYSTFASSSLLEIYGDKALQNAVHYSADLFSSVIVENKGNGVFEIHELPVEAQFSSVNGIVIEDLNGDQNLDLILAGNMYTSEVETARNDAGLGCVLLGDGTGGFTALPPYESGLLSYGDVKSVVLFSRGSQGKTLLVGNNSGYLQAFRVSQL